MIILKQYVWAYKSRCIGQCWSNRWHRPVHYTKFTLLAHIAPSDFFSEMRVSLAQVYHTSQNTATIWKYSMVRAVEILSQRCTTIEYLGIRSEFVLCSITCTSSLLLGSPALHTLVMNKFTHISPTTRKLCAIMRPQLKILVHDESTVYNVLTMPLWGMI